MLPLEIFHELDALMLLRPFWDRSKTMAPRVLHPIFGCLYNYAFVKASWHRISMKESRTTDGVTDGEIILYASQKSIKLIRQPLSQQESSQVSQDVYRLPCVFREII